MKNLLRLLSATTVTVLLCAIVILLVGGGLGRKEALPKSLATSNNPFLLAHRGAPGLNLGIPQNSFRAYKRALERGYRWIELDIQKSADDQFFILHDPTGLREVGIDTVVSDMPLAQIEKLHLLVDGVESSETVPALKEVVKQLGDTANFYFDIKLYHIENQIELADQLVDFVEKYNLSDRVIIAGSSLRFILYLEYTYPEIVTLLETSSLSEIQWLETLPRLFKPDLYANYTRHVTPELGEWLREEAMQSRLIAFHVSRASFSDALEWGITNFMIDDAPYLDSLLPQR